MPEGDSGGENPNRSKLVLVAGFVALIFGILMFWPEAQSQAIASRFGEQFDGFFSAERASQDSGSDSGSDSTVTTDDALVDGGSLEIASDPADAIPSDDLNQGDGVAAENADETELGESDIPLALAEVVSNDETATTSTSAGVAPSIGQAPPRSSATGTTAAPAVILSTTTTRPVSGPTTDPTVPRSNTTTTTAAAASAPVSGQLYVDPYNTAANWLKDNPDHPSADLINAEIASKSTAVWFGDWNLNVENDVRNYVDRAYDSDTIPVVIAYNIPNRRCNDVLDGAPDHGAYAEWIHGVADGLGNGPAIVLLEPGSLTHGDCFDDARGASISNAVTLIKDQCSMCSVYLDAGNSAFLAAPLVASRLVDADVFESDGIFSNVGNYHSTPNEADFGQQVLAALGNPSGLGQVIDTSRNGNGSSDPYDWCDQQTAAIGQAPSFQTGWATVDAFVWLKVPGESDGCVGPAFSFVPEEALRMINN